MIYTIYMYVCTVNEGSEGEKRRGREVKRVSA